MYTALVPQLFEQGAIAVLLVYLGEQIVSAC
jgi:hypothetical protein